MDDSLGGCGLDEISPLGRTTVLELRNGVERRWELDPADLGVGSIDAADLAGGSPAENATLIEEVLSGGGTAAAQAAVLANAAGAIYVAGLAGHYQSALSVAREALRGGAGRDALDRLRKAAPHR